jgi:hypothetical protein
MKELEFIITYVGWRGERWIALHPCGAYQVT